MYMNSMTDDELLTYAYQVRATELEKQLRTRFEAFLNALSDTHSNISDLEGQLESAKDEVEHAKSEAESANTRLAEIKSVLDDIDGILAVELADENWRDAVQKVKGILAEVNELLLAKPC